MCEKKEKPDIEAENGKPIEHRDNRPLLFDDALTLTKFGKFNVLLLILSGVILTTVLLETLGISFVLPVAQCDLKLTTRDKGLVSAVAFAGIITSSMLWGFLADTKGRRRVILPTLFLAAACSVMSSLTDQIWLFMILRYLTGFFISGPSATIYAYLGEYHNVRNRSRAIMGASFVFGVGCISLPLIAFLVINQEWEFDVPYLGIIFKPWRLFIIVCALPSLLSAIVLIYIPESPKFLLSKGYKVEALEILKKVYAINTGDKRENFKVCALLDEQEPQAKTVFGIQDSTSSSFCSLLKLIYNQTAPLFMPPYLKQTVIACTLQFGIFITSNGMYMFFPDILNRIASYTEANPGVQMKICEILDATTINVTALEQFNATAMAAQCSQKLDISTYEHSLVLEILYAIGFAFIGLLINSVGKLPILVFVLAGCGICGILTIITSIPIVSIYLYVILLMCGLAVVVVNAATVDLYPTHLRAMAVCTSMMMGRLGSIVGANVVGFLLETNCNSTFLFSGITLILCSFLSFAIPNIYKRSNKPQPRHSISSIGQ